MSDEIQQEIADAALVAQSTTVDGVSTSERPLGDLIEADKYLKANDSVSAIANGSWPMATFKIRPPGGRR